jgi:hypothetical protein
MKILKDSSFYSETVDCWHQPFQTEFLERFKKEIDNSLEEGDMIELVQKIFENDIQKKSKIAELYQKVMSTFAM